MDVDLAAAAARRADPEAARRWLEEQRVFIFSAMADTAAERRAAHDAIEADGAQAVWFDERGRDASATEAYLTGVDSATMYVGIVNKVYGTMLESGFSPTELEYMRAREGGKRTVVYVAEDAPKREGHLIRFIDRVRVFSTTETYRDADNLAERIRRRLHELAAEALSPWVKLGDQVFPADLIEEGNDALLLHARVNDDIALAVERLRGEQRGRARVPLTYSAGALDGEAASVKRTTRAGDDLRRPSPLPGRRSSSTRVVPLTSGASRADSRSWRRSSTTSRRPAAPFSRLAGRSNGSPANGTCRQGRGTSPGRTTSPTSAPVGADEVPTPTETPPPGSTPRAAPPDRSRCPAAGAATRHLEDG